MEVTWNGADAVQLFTPGQFSEKTCGLCGNYNGDVSDDMLIGPACDADYGSKVSD